MILFLLFLELLGVGAVLIGLLSLFIVNVLPTTGITETIIGIGIMASFCYLYILALNQFFLNLYRNMKVKYKVLELKETFILRSFLILLMLFHFYSLLWLEKQMDNLFHYIILVLFLSFFLGLAIKGMFDDHYQIKSSRETEELIFDR